MKLILFFCMIFLQSNFALRAHAEDLALDWKPEPEFGGFYEAVFQHYYEQAGLSIAILPGGAGQPVTQMVAAKKVKYGIAAADEVILARNQGEKVVALFAVYQNDPQGFMVHAERPIADLKSLFRSEGTIALQKGLPYTLWIEKQYAPFKAKIVPYTGGITSFIQDPTFSQQCFIFSEPIAAEREKQRIKTFLVSESGFNPYLTVVITHDDTLKNEPESVKKFVQATQKGWESYLHNSSGTNAQLQKLNSSLDLATFNQASVLQKPFIETPETKKQGLGFMSVERWKTLYSQMQQMKLVKSGMTDSQFFNTLLPSKK